MRRDSAHHEVSLDAIRGAYDSNEAVGWHPLLGSALIRVATNRVAFPQPSTLEACTSWVSEFRELLQAKTIMEGPDFWQDFVDLLNRSDVRGGKVSDGYWAALAIQHGATLVTLDRGFSVFPGLKWKNLLETAA